MRTKKETIQQDKKQKEPEVHEVSPADGCGCLWWKRFFGKDRFLA